MTITTKQLLLTTLIAGGVLTLGLGVASVNTFAHDAGGGEMRRIFGLDSETRTIIQENKDVFQSERDEIKAAVDANDYEALPDEIQALINQTQFQDMVTAKTTMSLLQNNHEIIKTAVDANDYDSLPDAIKSIITQERFDTMVTRHTQMEQNKTALETAVKANDYSLVPEDMKDRITQERFEKLVTYYQTNGTLPTPDKNNNKVLKRHVLMHHVREN